MPSFAPAKQHLSGVYAISQVISIILFAYILTYLVKLERIGCECAQDWRRKYIIFYSILIIALALYDLSVIVLHKDPLSHISAISLFRAPVILALGIVFVIAAIQYVNRLKREKCACSDTYARLILLIVAIIDAAVFSIVGLLMLASIIAFLFRSF